MNPLNVHDLVGRLKNKTPLELLESFTPDQLESRPSTPFVFEAPELHSKTKNWDASYIKSKLKDVNVKIYISADGVFPGGKGPYDPEKYVLKSMPLSEYLARVDNSVENKILGANEKYYLYQSPADLYTPLVGDIDISPYLDFPVASNYFWLSGAGNITPIHYDLSDNFLVQLMGEKQILIWNPTHYQAFKFNPLGSTHDRQSNIKPYADGENSWDEIADIPVFEHNLLPGQIVHIPCGWPHLVITKSLSASLNYWWDPPLITELGAAFKTATSEEHFLNLLDQTLQRTRPQLLKMVSGMASDGSLHNLLSEA